MSQVPGENFEKLRLSVASYGSEPCALDTLYDMERRCIRQPAADNLFAHNVHTEQKNNNWHFLDKYDDDVSIYYFKVERVHTAPQTPQQHQQQQQLQSLQVSHLLAHKRTNIAIAHEATLNSSSSSLSPTLSSIHHTQHQHHHQHQPLRQQTSASTESSAVANAAALLKSKSASIDMFHVGAQQQQVPAPSSLSSPSATPLPLTPTTPVSPLSSTSATNNSSQQQQQQQFFIPSGPSPASSEYLTKLRLWKCCTLVKRQNLTIDKILERIRNER